MIDGLTERIIARKEGATGWLVFNNPERRNAVSTDMWEAVPKVLAAFVADPQVRAIVLAGAGDKAFVSGADISQFDKQRSNQEQVLRYEELAEGAQLAILNCEKPTIAMIRGFCIGGGMGIACACDLRICSEDARLGITAAKMGLGYRASSMKMLVDVVGVPHALEVMLTARLFDAAEAKGMGLVHRVAKNDELAKAVGEYCELIGANAPLTMRAAKRIIKEVSKLPANFDAAQCRAWVKECYESEDYKEGRKAFMEKRKPAFKGR